MSEQERSASEKKVISKSIVERMQEVTFLSPSIDLEYPPDSKEFTLTISRFASEEIRNARDEARRAVNSRSYPSDEVLRSEMQEAMAAEYFKLVKKHLLGWKCEGVPFNPTNRDAFFSCLKPTEQAMLGILAGAAFVLDEANAGKKSLPVTSTLSASA